MHATDLLIMDFEELKKNKLAEETWQRSFAKTLENINKLFFLFFTSHSTVPNVLSAPSQYLFFCHLG